MVFTVVVTFSGTTQFIQCQTQISYMHNQKVKVEIDGSVVLATQMSKAKTMNEQSLSQPLHPRLWALHLFA